MPPRVDVYFFILGLESRSLMENLFYQFDANSDLRLDATAWLSIATQKCEFIRNAATPSDKSPVLCIKGKAILQQFRAK